MKGSAKCFRITAVAGNWGSTPQYVGDHTYDPLQDFVLGRFGGDTSQPRFFFPAFSPDPMPDRFLRRQLPVSVGLCFLPTTAIDANGGGRRGSPRLRPKKTSNEAAL